MRDMWRNISTANVRYKNTTSLLYSDRPDLMQTVSDSLSVHEDFITAEEEESICKELEPVWKRLRYEFSHWDNVRNPSLLGKIMAVQVELLKYGIYFKNINIHYIHTLIKYK